MLTAAGATVLLCLTAGVKFFTSAAFIGSALIFVLILWTIIGLVWLSGRHAPVKISLVKEYAYGLTFQGLSLLYDRNQENACLQLLINLHNYCPGPLRYQVEKFDVRIDTRSLPDLGGTSNSNFMPRGAQRAYFATPFKKASVREFFGTTQEGTVSISIIYGDVEKPASRRLKMSFKMYLVFPEESDPSGLIGYNSIIAFESDEPIGSWILQRRL